jgi:hypothetical protein
MTNILSIHIYDAFGQVLRPGHVVAYVYSRGEEVITLRCIISEISFLQEESWVGISWEVNLKEYRGDFTTTVEGYWANNKYRESIPKGGVALIKLAETVEEI